jgi:hypothetical protein
MLPGDIVAGIAILALAAFCGVGAYVRYTVRGRGRWIVSVVFAAFALFLTLQGTLTAARGFGAKVWIPIEGCKGSQCDNSGDGG